MAMIRGNMLNNSVEIGMSPQYFVFQNHPSIEHYNSRTVEQENM